MRLFEISREMMAYAISDERFQKGISLFIRDYAITPEEIDNEKVKEYVSQYGYNDIWKYFPLAYLSPVLGEGDKDREELLGLATDIYSPAWYYMCHICPGVALFIIYPLMKIIFNCEFYLISGGMHTLISNTGNIDGLELDENDHLTRTDDISRPCIIDIITQVSNNDDMIQSDFKGLVEVVSPESIMSWYIENYYTTDKGELQEWFNSF